MDRITIKAEQLGVTTTLHLAPADLADLSLALAAASEAAGALPETRFGKITVEKSRHPMTTRSLAVEKRKQAGLEG
ncbi:MAG: hypothetical protein CL806_14390 [Citromicrobium sp.]|nr:hypothetical protein [Citromicrobium sp.]|tara:strand:- start:8412 stop:8639 length:228 start_codon:yes stop_codon:yes gene_type:complete